LKIATDCEIAWERAGELEKHPPYIRIKEEQVIPDFSSSSGRINRAFGGEATEVRSDRVHDAMGVLSLEEDIDKPDLTRTI